MSLFLNHTANANASIYSTADVLAATITAQLTSANKLSIVQLPATLAGNVTVNLPTPSATYQDKQVQLIVEDVDATHTVTFASGGAVAFESYNTGITTATHLINSGSVYLATCLSDGTNFAWHLSEQTTPVTVVTTVRDVQYIAEAGITGANVTASLVTSGNAQLTLLQELTTAAGSNTISLPAPSAALVNKEVVIISNFDVAFTSTLTNDIDGAMQFAGGYPVAQPDASSVVIAAGETFTAVVKENGGVFTWVISKTSIASAGLANRTDTTYLVDSGVTAATITASLITTGFDTLDIVVQGAAAGTGAIALPVADATYVGKTVNVLPRVNIGTYVLSITNAAGFVLAGGYPKGAGNQTSLTAVAGKAYTLVAMETAVGVFRWVVSQNGFNEPVSGNFFTDVGSPLLKGTSAGGTYFHYLGVTPLGATTLSTSKSANSPFVNTLPLVNTDTNFITATFTDPSGGDEDILLTMAGHITVRDSTGAATINGARLRIVGTNAGDTYAEQVVVGGKYDSLTLNIANIERYTDGDDILVQLEIDADVTTNLVADEFRFSYAKIGGTSY